MASLERPLTRARVRALGLTTIAFAVTVGCDAGTERLQRLRSDDAVASLGASAREPTPEQRTISILVFADAPGNDNRNTNGEYVTLSNSGEEAVEIGGWTLCEGAAHCFAFPVGAAIPANGSIRLYTGSGVTTPTSFFMGFSRAVWNNEHDTATLRNGEIVIAQDIY